MRRGLVHSITSGQMGYGANEQLEKARAVVLNEIFR